MDEIPYVNPAVFDGAKETIIRQGGAEVYITIEDLKQIRIALLDALGKSQLGDRHQLIALTKSLPAWIDSDGRAMIGGWLLQLRKGQLVATYRLSINAERAVGYAASVVRENKGWRITQVVPEKIRFQPTQGH
jgi:hypothetical protein